MSRPAGMALRLLLASLRGRKRSAMLACAAVALGSSLAATAVGLRGTYGSFEGEMSAFGPNLLIVSSAGSALDVASLSPLDGMLTGGALEAYAPTLSITVTMRGRDVRVVGTRFAPLRQLYPAWRVDGTWPHDPGGALVGAEVAATLRIREGRSVELRTPHGRTRVRVAGVLGTGSGEENEILVDLSVAQLLAGAPTSVSSVVARVRMSRELPGVIELLTRTIPDADVRTPFLVARAEEDVLRRLERLLGMVAIVVLSTSALAVHATMAGSVVERRREVGVMKALGARSATIARLFAVEAGVIGLVGSLLGAALGLVFVEAIGYQVFGMLVAPARLAVLVAVAVGLGISILASLGPIGRAARMATVAALKGE